MWQTSQGMRKLHGAEAALVAAAIDVMVDDLSLGLDDKWEEDPSWEIESGVSLFDCLTTPQRIAMLHQVADYLLTDRSAPEEVSAAQEAAVAAIFSEVRDRVAMEIDLFGVEPADEEMPVEEKMPLETDWRRQVVDAYWHVRRLDPFYGDTPEQELGAADDAGHNEFWEDERDGLKPPAVECPDMDEWALLVECLTDSILWDRDFEMADSFLDADPGISEQRRRLLGISEDYFTEVAPDPNPAELPGLISRTRALVRAKPR